jgi:hypothetical protein
MKTKLRAVLIAAVAAAAFGTVFAPLATAGCVSPDEKGGSWRLTPSLAPAADTSMVGFWHVDFCRPGQHQWDPRRDANRFSIRAVAQ